MERKGCQLCGKMLQPIGNHISMHDIMMIEMEENSIKKCWKQIITYRDDQDDLIEEF